MYDYWIYLKGYINKSLSISSEIVVWIVYTSRFPDLTLYEYTGYVVVV